MHLKACQSNEVAIWVSGALHAPSTFTLRICGQVNQHFVFSHAVDITRATEFHGRASSVEVMEQDCDGVSQQIIRLV